MIGDLEPELQRYFYAPKVGPSERNRFLPPNAENKHPCVKPISLLRYLVKLGCIPGGIVLDPFCGSGSTGIAAVLEGMEFVGAEQDREYADLRGCGLEDGGKLKASVVGPPIGRWVVTSWSEMTKPYDEPGFRPVSDPPDLTGLPYYDAVSAVEDWFLVNFEHPANSTPYDSAEGGYIFISGGPYSAREVIKTFFGNTGPEGALDQAARDIEAKSAEWVPSSRRSLPADDWIDDYAADNPYPFSRHPTITQATYSLSTVAMTVRT